MISLSTHIPDFVFSASLPDKVVISNDHSVDVAITSDLGNVCPPAVYAVYNGEVTIYDFRRLIETFMEFKEQTVCRFSIKGAEDELKSFFVVYSTLGVDRDAKEWCNTHFLTTREAGEVTIGDTYTLSFVKTNNQPEKVEYFANLLKKDGTIEQAYFAGNTFEEPDSLCSVQVPIWDLDDGRFPHSVTVRAGARSFTFFRNEQPFNLSLKFKNAFGVWEVAHLCAVTERKSADNRKTANIMRRVAVYGAERKVSFTSTTAPLPIDTARWIDQLATSPQVRLFPSEQEIIMLNSPVEVSDSRTDSNSVKFSWQFPDGADHSREPRYLHIFQKPFDDVFA